MTFNRKIMLINFLISILFIVDRLTKWMVFKIPEGGLYLLSEKFVGFRLYKNFNLIFNIVLPEILIYFLIGTVLFFLLFFLFRSYGEKNTFLISCFSLIIAGAISNFVDRVYFGFVVDFISFFDYSIFNLSDVYIVAGVGLILIWELANKQKDK